MEPLRIVAGAREQVALWLLRQMPDVTETPGGYEAIGVARGTEIVGAALYTDYRPCKGGGQIQMWVAGHNWISRRVIRELLGYPFNEKPHGLGCHRINALVARSNKASRKMLADLGFVEEGKLRKGYDAQRDLIVAGMLKQDCRWLRDVGPRTAQLNPIDR